MSYNQWLKELRKVDQGKRKRRDTVAVFRYTKDMVIPEKAEPKGTCYRESNLGSEQEFSGSWSQPRVKPVAQFGTINLPVTRMRIIIF